MKDVAWTTAIVLGFSAAVVHWSTPDELPVRGDGLGAPASVPSVDEPIQPIVQLEPVDDRIRALGERLFHDPRLSRDSTQSCSTCHSLTNAGIDGHALGLGIDGQELGINVPTVLNASLNFRQFWDGRVASLEEQVDGPLLNPKEMGSSWEHVVAVLESDAAYVQAFDEIYGGPPVPEAIRHAIASFERTLVTPNSRFDRYLRGDAFALTPAEKSGYLLFKDYGCVGCHQGMGVGGNMFQRLGIVRNYFEDRGNVTEADLGRFNVTKKDSDRHVFKVPSLRNVARTSPYFHDGSARTLAEAIRIMARYQLGREIPDDEIAQIEAFLRSLNGEIRGRS